MSQSYASAGIPLSPKFQDWTATLVNLTQGDGTIVSRYQWDGTPGSLVTVHFEFHLGSTSSVGTAPTISTPVTAASSYTGIANWIGGGQYNDSGADGFFGPIRLQSATTFAPVVATVSGSQIVHADMTATVPFTWTNGDRLNFSVFYEAA